MEYMYNYGLPKDCKLLKDINLAASRLFNKLKYSDANSLCISDYNKRYLGEHLERMRYTLQKYSYILSWSVASTNVPLNKFVFLDYGGGIGILSLLAKEFKVGTVIDLLLIKYYLHAKAFNMI
jgi:hypothetical protein